MVVAAVLTAAFVFNINSCGYAKEIKGYLGYRDSAFYFGQRYCPATWKLPTKSLKEIEALPKDKKVEILSQKEDRELENILSDKFLGYNKYNAGEGKNAFYIYESICSQCELK